MAEDLRKFLAHSDYPNPQISYQATFSFTVPEFGFDFKFVDHGLPFLPLIIGQWSNEPSFAISYDLATELPNFAGGQPEIQQSVSSSASRMYFNMTNNTASPLTFYYRISAIAPPDYNGEIFNTDDNTNFKFNSDFNYQKIISAGKVNTQISGDTLIRHDLGYLPQTRIWRENEILDENFSIISVVESMPSQASNVGSSYEYLGARITPNELIVNNGGFPVYYQIYGDSIT